MPGLITTLSSALVGLTLVQPTQTLTLAFYGPDTDKSNDCSGASFQCTNIRTNYCCTSIEPNCYQVKCMDGCPESGDGFQMRVYSSDEDGYAACSSGVAIAVVYGYGDVINTCTSIDRSSIVLKCSAMVLNLDPSGGKRAADNASAAAGNDCLGVVEPDTLKYADADGVEQEVHLPNGTFQAAAGFAMAKDWDGLVKFLEVAK